jgi:tetratricopeptide (TPR) repeat protein
VNAHAVAEICCHLDGLPLAIELAAAWSKVLTPAMILVYLQEQNWLPGGGAQDLPARHQTLRNTLDWSYDLLTTTEQAWFRRLGIFVGGATLEAVKVVCTGMDDGSSDWLLSLKGLIDKSLLQQEATDIERRFTMLETIREYALERLEQMGENRAARQQHLIYYLQLSEQIADKLGGPHPQQRMERLAQEQSNLRAAIQWAVESQAWETLVRLCQALMYFWYVYGQPGEMQQWLEAVLAAESELPKAVRAKALHLMGDVCAEVQINYPKAQTFYVKALELWQMLDDQLARAQTLYKMGEAAMEQGHYDQACAWLEQSLNIEQRHGNQESAVSIRECLGVISLRQSKLDEAQSMLTDCLSYWRTIGYTRGEAYMLDNLGEVARYQGDYARACSLYKQAISLWQEAGDMRGLSQTQERLGAAALLQGEISQAGEYLLQSLTLRWEYRDYGGLAWNLIGLAEKAFAQGSLERAGRLGGASEALRTLAGTPIYPVERDRYQNLPARLRHQLGEAALDRAWSEGKSWPIEQIVAYAMQV